MKIFLCESIHPIAYQQLKDRFQIINDLKQIHECQIIISRNLKLNQSFLERCLQLELIVIHGTGYDDVDINYAKRHGIHLATTPYLNTLSVSELIISMMLQLSRKTYQIQNEYKAGNINSVAPIQYLGSEISYKTFGIIGTGHIALQTAKILKEGFHMHILAYSRSLTYQKSQELGIEYCATMDDVFKYADYVSINLSLNPETYHLITAHHLSLMKSSSFLINTSRGAIINEDDLYDTLKKHRIAGAGLDVLENEPISSHHRFLSLDNVIYTPHIGGSTDEALKRIGLQIVETIIQYDLGESLDNLLF